MALQVFRHFLRPSFRLLSSLNQTYSTDVYDPPYLENLKPKIPLYEPLNVQIKGYDFVLLESFQHEIHRIAKILDLEISDGWGAPGVKHKIQKLKPFSSIIDKEYVLTTYERNLQVVDLPSTTAGLFFLLIQAAQPQGVSLQVHYHTDEYEQMRFIPDMELKQLKTQLTDLGGPVKKK